MYDKLIKNLRICAAEANCKNCGLNDDGDCQEKLMKQAADAIEDLITALTASNEVIAKNKPKWIPVTERLPEKYVRVLVYSKATRMGRGIDFTNADGNWFSTQKVTHWMPLPESPKDGE